MKMLLALILMISFIFPKLFSSEVEPRFEDVHLNRQYSFKEPLISENIFLSHKPKAFASGNNSTGTFGSSVKGSSFQEVSTHIPEAIKFTFGILLILGIIIGTTYLYAYVDNVNK